MAILSKLVVASALAASVYAQVSHSYCIGQNTKSTADFRFCYKLVYSRCPRC